LPDALTPGRSYYWRAKGQDGANTGPYSAPAAFNLFTPVAFEPPAPLAPANNDKTTSLQPDFIWANAPRAGSPGPVSYSLEVSNVDSFATKLVAWQIDETDGAQTKFHAVTGFPANMQLFWRVRAYEATALGPWSNTAVFRTPNIAAPAPGPAPSPGGPCYQQSSHLAVLECRRKQWGHMDAGATLSFLRASAGDLNQGNFQGGPFALFRKTSGNNCGGLSCDIICSPGGGVWDVLYDWDVIQSVIWFYKGPDNGQCEK
jgi:hypothetical protein